MRRRRAFTLIELLFVVAVIAVMAAIAVPNFLEAQIRAKLSRTRTDMAALNAALRAYGAQYGNYPPNDPDLGRQLKLIEQNPPHTTQVTYNPLTPSGWNLTRLTTPAAWISNALPMDIFQKSFKVPNEVRPPNPYLYINRVELQNDAAIGSFAGAWGYGLISYGPNEVLDSGNPLRDEFLIYDPTNGTRSAGDLVLTGW